MTADIRRHTSAPISLASNTDPCKYLQGYNLAPDTVPLAQRLALLNKQDNNTRPHAQTFFFCFLFASPFCSSTLATIYCAFTMAVSFSRLSMSDSSSENDESDRLMEKGGSLESLLPTTRNNVAKAFTWGRLYSLLLHILCVGLIIALWMNRQQSSYAAALRGRSWCKSLQFLQPQLV